MKNNLLNGDYKTLLDFQNDFDLIISNCVFYNPNSEHAVRKSAEKFKTSFYNKFNKIKEEHELSEIIQIVGLEEMQ